MQALDDHHLIRLDALRRLEGAVRVVVDGLGDGLAALERPELLLHEREIVGAGVERGHPDQRPLAAIERVIVVEADAGDPVRTEELVERGGQRRLAAPAIAADADEDGRHVGARVTHRHRVRHWGRSRNAPP